ncbi:unnamed protein product [Aphanomyces euteiches]|nr:hypothetical protein Ae201684P_022257 [Aphanomyces euteiches]
MGIWSHQLDITWLEELVYQIRVLGKKVNSGYKKEAWSAALTKLNTTQRTSMKMQQLKSRHDIVNAMYGVFSKIVNCSGMGWEAESCQVQCLSTTWDSLLEGKPKSWHVWRSKPFPQYPLCERLFRGALATGRFAVEALAPSGTEDSCVDDESVGDNDDINQGLGQDDDDEEDNQVTQETSHTETQGRSGDKRQSKRQRPSLATKLSSDFGAVQETASKEFQLLVETLRPTEATQKNRA